MKSELVSKWTIVLDNKDLKRAYIEYIKVHHEPEIEIPESVTITNEEDGVYVVIDYSEPEKPRRGPDKKPRKPRGKASEETVQYIVSASSGTTGEPVIQEDEEGEKPEQSPEEYRKAVWG